MKFIICDTQRLQNCITHISNLPTDKGLAVEIYEIKKKRSLDQNALFHKWVMIIADFCGYSPEGMKTAIKRKILGMNEFTDPLTGEVSYMDYSTAKLTKEQFTNLMTETQVIAGDLGLILPTPDDRG